MNAHSDSGTFTLLFQDYGPNIDHLGGLEAAVVGSSEKDNSASYQSTGTWFDVPVKQGGVLVNVGYLLKRWTNRRWESLVHRVGVPPAFKSKLEQEDLEDDIVIPERFSVPFFIYPNLDTVVEPLPGMLDAEHPRTWPPIYVGDFLRRQRSSIGTRS